MNGGFVLGLTGKSGAGKNLAAAFLEKSGWIHFDTDKEAHRVLDGVCKEAAQLFGREILTESGKVDRARLGEIVFSSPEKMKQLESLLYPHIEESIICAVRAKPDEKFVINGANLTGSEPLCGLCDAVLVVRAPFWLRLWRSARRDRRPLFSLLKRFHYQKCFSVQEFFPQADIYTVSNITTKAQFEKKLKRLMEKRILKNERNSKRK